MYFIYPASVSENCDPRIVPAVAKCIERFFLVQLQDAMASGVLPLSRKWETSRQNYGGLLMECVKNFNKQQSLCESKMLTEATHDEIEDAILDYGRDADHATTPLEINEIIERMRDVDEMITSSGRNGTSSITDAEERELSRMLRDYIRRAESRKNEIRRDQDRIDRENQRRQDKVDRDQQRAEDKAERDAREQQRRQEKEVELRDRLGNNQWNRDRQRILDDENRARQARQDARQDQQDRERAEDRAREAQEREDERNKSAYRTGSYSPLKTGVDIAPTSGTVNVNVLYKGGKLDGKMQDDVDVTINVKVIPTIIKNFRNLENDLLNDYFSRKSDAAFKSIGRNIARTMYNKFKRFPFGIGDVIWKAGMNMAGEDVDAESRKDIIYNTQGFVNASAFHRIGASPNNYNYTSNIVIFNKDDLTDPDNQNIFQNRSAMIRLFKMGWSTFCMLDPVEEMMYFISSLDGGYMHQIPYRYIMESIGTRSYYGDNDRKLKDSAKPFLIKRGTFNDFARQFLKKRVR